ncbi:hypothetical protein [Streptomyces sp. NPDC000931]|uniref:hypothetical protein n=1 Tax=Streptomyces sp. NPDC000931 TaxID=3154372 RepID=UPI00331719FD
MNSPMPPDAVDVPPEHALLVVDMKGYSKIPEAKMAPVRADLDDILATVLAQSGLDLPAEGSDACKDTGDGVILVFPAHALPRLVDPLLGLLNAALVRYERERLASAPAILLRASVHTGPLSLPDHRGDAINEACRLVNSQAVRQAMFAAADTGTFLAAVLSEIVYRRTVCAGRTPNLSPRHFLQATAHVSDKPDFGEPCRVHVPGMPGQAIHTYIADAAALHSPAEAPEAAQAPSREGTAPVGNGPSFQFLGAVYEPTIAGSINTVRNERRQR